MEELLLKMFQAVEKAKLLGTMKGFTCREAQDARADAFKLIWEVEEYYDSLSTTAELEDLVLPAFRAAKKV